MAFLMQWRRFLCVGVWTVFGACACASAADADPSGGALESSIRVAVQTEFAHINQARALASTQKQLVETFGADRVQFLTLRSDELLEAAAIDEFDFFIVDAGFYSRLETTQGLKAVASFWPVSATDPSVGVGALFVARSDDESIANAADFVGKRLAASYADSFAGFQIGLRDLYQKGIILESLKNRITFYGTNPKSVLQSVVDGNADVAMLPTCEFERLTQQGQFDRAQFHLIDVRDQAQLHCARSTDLYPGFYFAASAHTDFNTRKAVSAALFTMNGISQGADWSLPVSNRSVHDLLFDLKVGPYADLSAWRLNNYAKEQSATVMIFLTISFLIIFYAGSLSVLVRRRTKMLDEALADRNRIEKLANASRDHIANLERTGIVGQMSTMIAHELKQPLGAITNFANGLLRRAKRGNIDPKLLIEVLEEIVEQGTRASEIVNRVRAYAKHQTPELKMADMSVSIERAIETFKRSRRSEAHIHKEVMPYLWADIDGWEIELAVLNLLKNAADAIEHMPEPEILVRVSHEDRFWRIEVVDNGPLITQEEVDRFLQPLVTSKEAGLGLGISIVNNIVERHHGRLTARANPTGGVTMAIDIPHAVMPEHTAM